MVKVRVVVMVPVVEEVEFEGYAEHMGNWMKYYVDEKYKGAVVPSAMNPGPVGDEYKAKLMEAVAVSPIPSVSVFDDLVAPGYA